MLEQNVTYELEKNKSHKIRDESRKGSIFLHSTEITSLYKEQEEKEYMSNEIAYPTVLKCFVSKVECLKLELVNLEDLKSVTFYFSELKLVRIGNTHPKEMWEKSHSYFKGEIEGEFIELTVAGS